MMFVCLWFSVRLEFQTWEGSFLISPSLTVLLLLRVCTAPAAPCKRNCLSLCPFVTHVSYLATLNIHP